MHTADVAPVAAAEQAFSNAFVEEFCRSHQAWVALLAASPGRFDEIERAVRDFFLSFAGLALRALLANKQVLEAIKEAADRWRANLHGKWRHGKRRTVRVQTLIGDTVEIVSRYYIPRRKRRKRRTIRSREKVGVSPELAVLGIEAGVSPGIRDEASRLTVLLPSMNVACDELGRRGIVMDVKKLRRVVYETGERALACRNRDLERWRLGELEQGDELKGKRVVVSIDGGKARVRRKKKGPKTKKGRSRYRTDWREPRLLIIYTVDENGRRERLFDSVVDGSLRGADVDMELLAFHLYRLGASKAESVLFVSDGAEWIWDRVESVFELAGIPRQKTHYLLDAYHANQRISEALKTCAELSDAERKRIFKRLRRKLLSGKASEVISDLKLRRRGKRGKAVKDLDRHIAYLETRIPLLRYDVVKQLGLPLGSGAVESAIRRVINLRIKAPGTFWEKENLELVAYMRAQALTGRWQEMLDAIQHSLLDPVATTSHSERPPIAKQVVMTRQTVENKALTELAA